MENQEINEIFVSKSVMRRLENTPQVAAMMYKAVEDFVEEVKKHPLHKEIPDDIMNEVLQKFHKKYIENS